MSSFLVEGSHLDVIAVGTERFGNRIVASLRQQGVGDSLGSGRDLLQVLSRSPSAAAWAPTATPKPTPIDPR